MTFADLNRVTLRKADEEIENIDLRDWYNECQDELSSVLYLPTDLEVLRDGDGAYPLPANYKDGLTVELPDDGGFPSSIDMKDRNRRGFYIRSGKVYLRGWEPASVTIHYNRLPAAFTTDPDFVPDIPQQYHYIFPIYAVMQAMFAEDEPERYMQARDEYYNAKRTIVSMINRQRKHQEAFRVVR